MKCPRCQHENPLGQKFCGECGACLAAACPSCGASNPPGQKFCGECGASLTQAAPPGKFASPEGERGFEVYVLNHLADLAEVQGPPDVEAAEDRYRHALALASELGMRPLVAQCHAGLAKLYRRTGKRIESDEHFATATTMYREMGMTYWLEQVEREK